MVATWSDSDHSSSEREPKMEIKANLCLMAIDDEVCVRSQSDARGGVNSKFLLECKALSGYLELE